MVDVLKRNNVQIIGNGKQVLLFTHGFGCDQTAWHSITAAFETEYKIVLFDFVGAGNSDISAYDSTKYSSLNGYVEDLLEILHVLKLSDVIFIGHSVGNMIGLLAAIKQPTYFNKLIFISPSPCYINDDNYHGGFDRTDLDGLFEIMDNNYLAWSKNLAPQIMGNADRPELGENLAKSFCSYNPAIARQFARVTFLSDNRNDLKNLTVKSVTLQCAQDIIAPTVVGQYLNQNTPGNQIIYLKATGHCPQLSAPEETIAVLKDLIN